MLFFINKPDEGVLERIRVLGSDEDKSLFLFGDGVSFAAPFWSKQLDVLNRDRRACRITG